MTSETPSAAKLKRLPATSRPKPADFTITRRHVWVDPDVTLDDLKRPAFWAHHHAALNPGDLVDVLAKDFSLDVQLRVVGKEVGLVQMRVVRAFTNERPKAAAPEVSDEDLPDIPANYKVQFSPKAGWLVRTIDPPETVATHKTKPAAYQAAIQHAAKAMGVAA
ncbi:hypothetical protein [Chelativorans xinjiangense]|uniref:hypothetical protein n=1 Tax=Chelativorans xinjiangense TaxID=2681485 RepID=UPI00135CF5B4|nr:hypothetical protein [Chelativorans xinjiangense]